MRCPRCGNENSDDNRYCGMCGVSLRAEPLPDDATPVSTSAAARAANPSLAAPPAPAPSVPARAVFDQTEPPPPRFEAREDSPSISGPSFLGLNDPPPSKRRSGSLSITSSADASNLNYLLDDEEPKRGGAGKYFLILLALVLVGGLGYYRWSHGLAPWSIPREAKPLAAQDSGNADNTAPAAAPTPATSAPAQPADSSASAPAATPPTTTAATNPATNPTTNSATNPAAANPSTAQSTTSAADGSAATPPDKPAVSTRQPTSARSEAPVAKRPKPLPKPAAAIEQADRVTEAHKYLYGRDGMAQDCDRGLRLLKPLANGPNPKAMIEMGALYSAGLCTPHDLPTAYRWFAMALRQDPENQVAKTDLQKLWSEMTRPEQQLAIRLSQ